MRSLIANASKSALARRTVRGLRLHRLGNWWLGRFPLVKRLSSGVAYRATRLESVPLSVEMLEQGKLYDDTLLPAKVVSFADLGCNVGYFSCWLAHVRPGQPRRGLMIDANPQAVSEAAWHARANQWDDVHALHGILGEKEPGQTSEFYLYESNICSASQLPDVEALGLSGKWQRIEVPCLSLEQEWVERFGDLPCDLLKVDIEGSELHFLQTETAFLKRTGAVLVEWHKWRVQLDDIKAVLEPLGLAYVKTLEEQDQLGTAYFRRG